MSEQSEDPAPIDLSSLTELQFMPDWVRHGESPAKKYRDVEGDRPGKRGGGKRGGGFRGKGGGHGGGGHGGGGGGAPGGRGRGEDGKRGGGFRGKAKGRGDRGRGSGERRGHGGGRDEDRQPRPPRNITATLAPGELAIKQLADQIKKTLRSYPVFDIAKLVIAGRDRYSIEFKRDDDKAPELFVCEADGSAWLQRPEALAHLGSTPAFSAYYSEETIQGDPPKGNYTSIAVCGMSNTLLGPPNHHSYQANIAKLHRTRFSNMPLERFKSRIRVERDEEIVERWKTEQSVRHRYTYHPGGDARDAAVAAAGDAEAEPAGPATGDETPGSDEMAEGAVPETGAAAAEEPATPDAPEEQEIPEPAEEPPTEEEEDAPAKDTPDEEPDGPADQPPDDGTDAPEDDDSAEEEDRPAEEPPPEEPDPPSAGEDAAGPAEEAAEALVFEGRDAAERHFVEQHADQFIKSVPSLRVSGAIAGKQLSPGLLTLLRGVAENARKHPASLVQPLCGLLSGEGLKFFKRGRQIYACVTRPKPLSDDNSLSPPIRSIVSFLREHKRCKVDDLLAALAPQPAPAEKTGEESAAGEGGGKPAPPPLTPEQIKVLQDLRWLLHEGAVIAFDTGHLELAVSKSQPPAAKKPKPRQKSTGKAAPAPAAAAESPSATAPSPDASPEAAPAREADGASVAATPADPPADSAPPQAEAPSAPEEPDASGEPDKSSPGQ